MQGPREELKAAFMKSFWGRSETAMREDSGEGRRCGARMGRQGNYGGEGTSAPLRES